MSVLLTSETCAPCKMVKKMGFTLGVECVEEVFDEGGCV